MKAQDAVKAVELLRRRDDLIGSRAALSVKSEIGRLTLATPEMQRGRVSMKGADVTIQGDVLTIVTDLIGSQLTHQIAAVEAELADLGVSLGEDAAEPTPECAKPGEQDPGAIEIMVFTAAPPCDCPLCQAARP